MMMLSIIIIIGIALASAGTMTRTAIGVLPSSSLATSKSNESVNAGISLLYNTQKINKVTTLLKIW